MKGSIEDCKGVTKVFGGVREYSDAIAIPFETAKGMHRRNSISPDHWPAVIAAAAVRGLSGITIEKLAELRATNRRATAANLPTATAPVTKQTGGNCS